ARTDRGQARAEAFGEDAHADPVEIVERDVAERGSEAPRMVELGRLAERHAGARVDDQVQRQVLLGRVQLEEQLVEPRIDVPVDVAEVVAGPVVTEVGELQAATALRAGALAAQQAAEDLACEQLELLELAQERLVE